MTDDRTPRDAEGPGHEPDSSEGTEEFAHSDRARPVERPTAPTPTTPVPPPADEPEPPARPVPSAPARPVPTRPVPAAPGAETTEDDALEDVVVEDEAARAPAAAESDETDGVAEIDGVAEEPSAQPAETAASREPTSLAVPILAVTTALLFVATVLFGLMAFAPRLSPIKSGPAKLAAKAQEQEELKDLARRFATNFVSIDYKTIDADLKEMTKDTTTNFGEKLHRTVEVIGKQFTSRKASSSGSALDAAVLSHTEDSAIVQVLLRRTKRNVGTEGPETGNQVVNVTLVNTDNGWKVDDLSQLGAESQ